MIIERDDAFQHMALRQAMGQSTNFPQALTDLLRKEHGRPGESRPRVTADADYDNRRLGCERDLTTDSIQGRGISPLDAMIIKERRQLIACAVADLEEPHRSRIQEALRTGKIGNLNRFNREKFRIALKKRGINR